jgi:hypothetical protein
LEEYDELEAEIKEYKLGQFLARQDFMAQEKEILRQMREFCAYGSIKVDKGFKLFS